MIDRNAFHSCVICGFQGLKEFNFREKKRTFWGWQIQRLFFLQRLWPARSYLVVHLVYSSWGENNQVFSTRAWIKTVCSRILGLIPEHILWKKTRTVNTGPQRWPKPKEYQWFSRDIFTYPHLPLVAVDLSICCSRKKLCKFNFHNCTIQKNPRFLV